MSIITIKNISHEQKVSKNGKTYESCTITVVGKEGKDIFLSGFGSNITKTWCPGDEVNITVSQTDRGYWNFETNDESKPKKTQLELLREINEKLDILINKESFNNIQDEQYPKPTDVKLSEIPF